MGVVGGRVVSVGLAVRFDVDGGGQRGDEFMVQLVLDLMGDVMSLFYAQPRVNGDGDGDS